jgi:hypothetical protein
MRSVLRLLLLIVAATATITSPAFGFGDVGHLTVCEIAARRISAGTRAALAPILGGRELARLCTWPDEAKRHPAWKATSAFHFANIETFIGEADETGKNPPTVWDDPTQLSLKGDMLQVLALARHALPDAKRSPASRLCHLRFLGHLAGDSHQPLHYGRRSDFGGNAVHVEWNGIKDYVVTSLAIADGTRAECFDQADASSPPPGCAKLEKAPPNPTNIHQLWDDLFIDLSLKSRFGVDMTDKLTSPLSVYGAYAGALLADAARGKPGLPSTAELDRLAHDDLLRWAESVSRLRVTLAYRDLAFASPFETGLFDAAGKQILDKLFTLKTTPESYFDERLGTIEALLLTAGARMAGLLDELLDPSYRPDAHAAFHASRLRELETRIAVARGANGPLVSPCDAAR